MKKIIAMLLMCSLMLVSLVACNEPAEDPTKKSEGVMTYAEYMAAEMESTVVVDTYVQAKQTHWDGKARFYTQDGHGAYFIYDMPCTEAEYEKLVPGTKIKVTGRKTEWAGEVEIADATFEIMSGTYIAPVTDVTSLLANETELIKHQNKYVSVKGLTVEGVEFQNGSAGNGNDIYVTVSLDGVSYSFCVEAYNTATLFGSETYTTASGLTAGDKIYIEGFLYWYDGANTHITKITKK